MALQRLALITSSCLGTMTGHFCYFVRRYTGATGHNLYKHLWKYENKPYQFCKAGKTAQTSPRLDRPRETYLGLSRSINGFEPH